MGGDLRASLGTPAHSVLHSGTSLGLCILV